MADENTSAPPEQQDDAVTQEIVTETEPTEITDAVADTKPDSDAQEPTVESQITDAVTQPDTKPTDAVAQEPSVDSQITDAVTQPDTEPTDSNAVAQEPPVDAVTQPDTEPQAGTVSEDTKPTDTVADDTKAADTEIAVPPQDNEEAQTTGGDRGVADTALEPLPEPISGKQLQMLLVGTEMNKVKKGNKLFSRIYSVSDDLLRIVWNSRRKSANKAQISLSQIKRVLSGRQTESFALHKGELAEDRCFSIEYVEGGVTKTLDLVCLSNDTVQLWINGLRALTQQDVAPGTVDARKKMLRVIFDEADDNKDGTLDLKEVLRLLRRLNIGISQKVIRQKFKQADTGGNSDNRLDFDEFVQLYTDLSDRPELRKIFNLYATSHNGSYMSLEDISKFVTETQKVEDASQEYCQSIIERFEPSSDGQKNLLLSLDGFVQYMVSKDNDIFKRSHTQIYQDMAHPLSHYFIASSHNTYLLEDQLSGPSSVEAYVNALKKGCRCVELDCWDGDDGDPVIYHGHTLTSKILFKDAIQGIKEHAFTVSSYPLILSIENHCGVEQQAKMAQYMIDIFGDLLHKETRDEEMGKLPSPESLKNKILVKAKKLPKEHEDKSDDEGEVSDEDEAAEIDPEEVQKAKSGGPSSVADRTGSPEPKPESAHPPVRKIVYSNERQRTRSSTVTKKPQKKLKLSSKLSRCVNYVQSISFKGFEQAIAAPFYHMSSFGESSAFKHAEQSAADYVEYNKVHLARTYPSGVRVDSSNYEPVDLWNCGCQIVALNYQTTGKPMDMVMGKFQQNGRSGYILKPEIMREDFSHFNHKNKEAYTSIVPKLLTLRVISGQQLPKPEKGNKEGEVIDPYVLVQFCGVAQDKAEYRTKFVNDNGFNPVWNKTIQHVVTFPELCLIRFKVLDYDVLSQDDFIGQYTLPFDSMELGYRHIPIHTANWDRIEGATLFVEVHIEEWFGPTPKSKDRVRQSMIKKSRQYPSSKQVHYQTVDRTVREGQNSVHNAIDIKEDYHFRTAIFKESCGKSSRSTIQECMEALFISANIAKVEIKMVPCPSSDKTIYQIETSGAVPGKALQDMINGFNELNGHISTLFNLGESLADELENSYSTLLGLKDEFFSALEQTQPKKSAQAKENYSHNLLVLRKEAKELRETVSLAAATIDKAVRCAQKFITIPTPSTTQEPSKEEPKNGPAESATPAASD